MFIFWKMLFTAVEFASITLFCLSLFRIYFRYSLHKVAFIAIIEAIVSVYTRDILNEPGYAFLSVLASKIALITVVFQLPIIFSLLIAILGGLATLTVEALVVYLGSLFNLFTVEQLKVSIIQFMIHDILVAVIMLVLVYYLQKFKFGFHTTNNDALKGYNFLLSGLLVVAVVTMQIQTLAFTNSSLHILLVITLGLLFLIGFFLTYKHNQKLWKARRERLANRK